MADSRLTELHREIDRRWPEAICRDSTFDRLVFPSGLAAFDSLFPMGGLPYGQLVEITGGDCSGKTSFLFALLAGMLTRARLNRVAYVDFANCFFPVAAECGGIDPARLFVVKPDNIKSGLRAAELLLKHGQASVIVCDLVQVAAAGLPLTLLHRLRRKITRWKGLVIFLTDHRTEIVPASMASLKVEVERSGDSVLRINVVKSRLCSPGQAVEVTLETR